jgi:3-polyprenyl-4-hydroxybenzoate decarboxylase
VRILVAITGASGALYAQRLLDNLDARQHEIHLVISNYGQAVPLSRRSTLIEKRSGQAAEAREVLGDSK